MGNHSASSLLERLHDTLEELRQEKAQLASNLRDELSMVSLYY